ncbi:hypothetical protein Q7381_11880 [Glaesserella parasuis]|nr:hypothetical protein [Glaesserella parasuis]MDP0121023.1 hypothetical protein [Glaesserella parasuis]MDP0273824.1 hypothetical protein [Glaesserella parasuis]MDP0307818.1 hypothetical protein [Glaesserella parasuis]MDP0472577.1 hypothetical protein [Glaesserella parasuis]
MKVLLVLLVFLLNGCYLANGSPSSVEFWVKNGNKISINEVRSCQEKSFLSLGKRFEFLKSQFYKNGEYHPDQNSIYYKEYSEYRREASRRNAQCFYGLGYRFKAPLYWCLAQDGDNTRICTENIKYRN